MKKTVLANIGLDQLAAEHWRLRHPTGRDPVLYFERNPISEPEEDPFERQWIEEVLGELPYPEGSSVLDVGAGDGRIARELRTRNMKVKCLEPSGIQSQRLRGEGFEVLEEQWLEKDACPEFDYILFCRSLGVSALKNKDVYLVRAMEKSIKYARFGGTVISPPIEKIVNPGKLESQLFPGGMVRELYTPAILGLLELGVFPQTRFISQIQVKGYDSLEQCKAEDFKYLQDSSLLDEYIRSSCTHTQGGLSRDRHMITMLVNWSKS